jgi:hypothetical protein
MRVRLSALAAASLVLTACGGGGTPAPAGLAYALPNPTTATYVSGDTVNVDIDAGGQSMQSRIGTSTTFGATFTRAADGIQVSMEVQDFSARVTQPMGGPVTMDGSGIDGPLVFTLDRRGDVTMVAQPTLSGDVREMFAPLSTAHAFFPGLPGTAVDVGDTWTDTVHVQGPEGSGEVNSVSIFTYTVAGDTVLDGRRLTKITYTGTQEASTAGVMAGMDFTQEVTGTVEGHVLWDMAAGLMVERFADADGRGSIEVPAAPFPLGIRARSQSTVRLMGGM